MIDRDAYLLHQVHAAKLATDVIGGLLSAGLMWRRQVGAALLVAFVPSALASALVLRRDTSKLRDTRRGRYVLGHMPALAQAVRLLGQAIVWRQAYRHDARGALAGAITILIGWSHGLRPLRRRGRP